MRTKGSPVQGRLLRGDHVHRTGQGITGLIDRVIGRADDRPETYQRFQDLGGIHRAVLMRIFAPTSMFGIGST